MTMIIDGSTGLEFPDGSDQSTAFTGNAATITSGTIATARLGSGTANSTTYLRGDQTWAAVPATTPGGSTTQVQYNNAGAFGGDSGFVYTGGNVGIGTSSPARTLDVNGNMRLGTANGRFIEILNASSEATYISQESSAELRINQSTSGANSKITFLTQGSERMRITSTGGLSVGTTADPGAGAIYATGAITAYYSDDRLKTKLGGIDNALDKVKSLSGFYYEANQTAQDLGYQAVREVGVSAQQVQAVLPEVVKPAPIDEQYLTVDYERLVPLLIEAIKELEAQVAELKAKQ